MVLVYIFAHLFNVWLDRLLTSHTCSCIQSVAPTSLFKSLLRTFAPASHFTIMLFSWPFPSLYLSLNILSSEKSFLATCLRLYPFSSLITMPFLFTSYHLAQSVIILCIDLFTSLFLAWLIKM